MTETLVPALQDAASDSAGHDDTEAFFWTVDVHCGDRGDDDDGEGGSEAGSDADSIGSGGGGRDTWRMVVVVMTAVAQRTK